VLYRYAHADPHADTHAHAYTHTDGHATSERLVLLLPWPARLLQRSACMQHCTVYHYVKCFLWAVGVRDVYADEHAGGQHADTHTDTDANLYAHATTHRRNRLL